MSDKSKQGNKQGVTALAGGKPQGQSKKAQGQETSAPPASETVSPVSSRETVKPGGETKVKEKKPKPERAVPAHMAKIDKVAQYLPKISGDASTLLLAANQLSTSDMSGLVAHLTVAVRRRNVQAVMQGAGEEGSSDSRVVEGARVRINEGHPRFAGQLGTVLKAQRIRCYVKIDGSDKERGDYFYKSEVSALGESPDQVVKRLTTPAPAGDIISFVDDESTELPSEATG